MQIPYQRLYLFSHPGVKHPGVWGCVNSLVYSKKLFTHPWRCGAWGVKIAWIEEPTYYHTPHTSGRGVKIAFSLEPTY